MHERRIELPANLGDESGSTGVDGVGDFGLALGQVDEVERGTVDDDIGPGGDESGADRLGPGEIDDVAAQRDRLVAEETNEIAAELASRSENRDAHAEAPWGWEVHP